MARSTFTRLAAAVALAGAASVLTALPTWAIGSGKMYDVLVQAPNFTLTSTTDGSAVSLSDYTGKVRLVTFWASWCPSCRKEIPTLINLQSRYEAKGLQVIAVATDLKEAEARDAYVKQMGFNFPSLERDDRIKEDYGRITSIPTTFLIGRKGYIYKHYIGAYPEATLDADVKRLL
jgi:thiol-disulfide isomerase/thioredoxin